MNMPLSNSPHKDDMIYAMPAPARKKMLAAKKRQLPVYIYGATYYGKTTFVQQILKSRNYDYFSCASQDLSELLQLPGKGCKILVIDDLHALRGEQSRRYICRLLSLKSVWLILINRAPMPSWLIDACVRAGTIVISEGDLHLHKNEIRELMDQHDIQINEKDLRFAEENSEGNLFAILHYVKLLAEKQPLNGEGRRKGSTLLTAYFENQLLPSWEDEVLDFLIMISVVESFTLDLAEFITGDLRVYATIEKAQETGNFLSCQGDVYHLRPQLRRALLSYGLKTRGHDSIRAYQYSAGLYYELHDQLADALHMYEASGHIQKIRDILLRNSRRNPANGFYFELRNHYLKLPKEDIRKEPELMVAMSMLHSILMQPEESEYWVQQLKAFEKKTQPPLSLDIRFKLAYLDIALPHRGVENIPQVLLRIAQLTQKHEAALPEFSLTSNLPSILNGGKDFSVWFRKGEETISLLNNAFHQVLGDYAKGLSHGMLGELYLETGKNTFDTLKLLTKARLEAENGGKKELEFAIVGVQSRAHLINGELRLALSMLDSFAKTLTPDISRQLLGNLETLRLRLHLYDNDYSLIEPWMQQAPDENEVFFVMDRYRYLTKIRIYLLNDQYTAAISLLEKLRYYGEEFHRPALLLETDLLECIILERLGEAWEELLLKALANGYTHQLVRIFSQEGAVLYPLLKQIKKSYTPASADEKAWWKQVLSETEKVARFYPGYLSRETITSRDFSENALRILQLQADGFTTKQISETLNLAETTVKYHASETYRKLQVRGKTDAVQKARQLKLI
ncbi:MAG: LuxR C-terminal-related transcriptional regulator [Lachnospiraceae bacterium]|nr:LuxR C-terminal-related transcriptional regulator [Lachnospiraceae bacterium]